MEPQNFLGLGGLTDLGARSGMDMRPTLLRVLTDLYVHRLSHTPDEERHYTELALRMLEVVDVPTRIAAAKRFARYPSPPLRVLQWLARDLPDVAAELALAPAVATACAVSSGAAKHPPDADRRTRGTRRRRTARRSVRRNRLDHSPKAQRSFLRSQRRRAAAYLAQSRRCRSRSRRTQARGARSVRRRAPRSGGPLRQARRLRASARPRAVDSARPGTSYRARRIG